MGLFSRRHIRTSETHRYDFPQEIRNRILHTIRISIEADGNQNLSVAEVLFEMRDKILQRYGAFRSSMYEAARVSNDPAIEHFFKCTDEEVVDFVQMCFETRWNCGGQKTVDAVNAVLDDAGIGYQLTPIRKEPCESHFFGRKRDAYRIIPPTVVRRDEERMHTEVVQPCLAVLSDSRFGIANNELLNALGEYRKGKYGDAVTDAGAAVESVLKTIRTEKGWSYDKEKDACSKLLDVCRENGLFHQFHKPILERTATIRNKIGDAHGKGPASEYVATKELADHMIYTCCANISLLIKLAGL
jgi:hypothetical protein